MEHLLTGEPTPDTGATLGTYRVQDACTAALASHKAWLFLSGLLNSVPDSHPFHRSATDTLELVQIEWLHLVDTVGSLPAASGADVLLKAAVLSRAIERDDDDEIVGSPALALAASLADDILVRPELGRPARAHA